MSYRSWFQHHGEKHKKIVDRLVARGYTTAQIIDYFDFDNVVVAEPDFCPLYAQSKQCHDIEKLNCYLCACPLFRFNADGISESQGVKTFSYCDVDSKFGRQGRYGDAIHQDCTNCAVPHGKKYVSVNFDLNWFDTMKHCDIGA
ncbi:MAG TPA: hypothetical protein VFM32_04170 [Spongiibacteraceae bacterium]|nr:hypothetical protein [Spongiibacteraceae bacterium]